MELLISVAALVGVGAITPGPNNFAVMSVAARSGLSGAWRAIAGVVCGSLVLFALAAAGASALLDAHPRLRMALCIAGCTYLGYLGVRLIMRADTSAQGDQTESAGPRTDGIGLFAFQFFNPKSWTLVLAAASAAQASAPGVVEWLYLAAIFVGIPALCLTIWTLFGLFLAARLQRPRFRAVFDRAMGGALLASAILLLIEGLAP